MSADLLRCGVRAAQLCAIIAAGIAVNEYGWWGFLGAPIAMLIIFGWQLVYEAT